MLTLLHLSDLHFGPPYVPAVGEALQQIAPKLHPNVIVVSGDFTQRAKREQFAQAREFIDRLPDVPKVVVPGNHDVPLYRVLERLFRPHDLYCEYISRDLDQVLTVDGAVIVALDSTSPRRAITNGRIYRQQLDFCTRAFENAPDDASRIVVAHHHFAPAPDYAWDRAMPKAKRAMNHFIDLRVDLVLGGHLHRAYVGNSLDFYPGKSNHGVIIVQCGTTTSRRGRGREREKNSFNLIQIGHHQMIRVTHYMYFDDPGEFAPLSRHVFPRPGERFVEDDHPPHGPETLPPHESV